MIFVCSLWLTILLPILIHADDTSSSHPSSSLANFVKNTYTTTSALDWVSDSILNVINSLIPNEQPFDGVEGRRKKKFKLNKFVLPLLIGFLLIKSILLPIALKFLAVLSGKAVVLSLMSLILAAIVGLRAVAQNRVDQRSDNDVVHLPLTKYRRKDFADFRDHYEDEEPYRYYRERRRRK